jgi:hypothetical protein
MRHALVATLLAFMSTAAIAQAQAQTCSATSGSTPPQVVELYTSEGCSSCPPADRWLSTLKGQPGVLALAFHVNYWDRLGWPDRFASPEATARQYQLAQAAGSRNVYTPQVIVNGRDWRDWPRLPAAVTGVAPRLTLSRDGNQVVAQVEGGGSGQWAGYWAVLEDQHVSQVRAGENAGETLRHDHVVRLYKPVPAWNAAQAHRSEIGITRGEPAFPRRVAFVVTDARQRPVQALALAC